MSSPSTSSSAWSSSPSLMQENLHLVVKCLSLQSKLDFFLTYSQVHDHYRDPSLVVLIGGHGTNCTLGFPEQKHPAVFLLANPSSPILHQHQSASVGSVPEQKCPAFHFHTFYAEQRARRKELKSNQDQAFFFFSKHTFFCSLVIKAFLNQSKSLLNCSHLHFFLLSDNLAGMKHWFCDINVTYSAGGQHFHLCLTGTSIWSPFFNTIASLSKPRLQTMNTRWRLWTWVIVFVGFKGLRDKKERIKVTCLGCRTSNRKYREYTEKRNTFGEDCLCTCFISYSFYSRQLTCMVWKRHWFVTILPVILAPNWHWKDADCANVVGPEFDAVSF